MEDDTKREPRREVICADAIDWLKTAELMPNSSFVASLPDISEFSHNDLKRWSQWFQSTAGLILSRCPPLGLCIFFQSDIKFQGTWVDKAFLVQKAAEAEGMSQLWHKIVCRVEAGTTTFGRPSYSHLLCFSRERKLVDLAQSSPDVFFEAGDKTWQRGMGLEVALFVSRFIAEQSQSTCVINPFCGEGSVLAACNHEGLDAIGIERSVKRAEISRRQNLSADGKRWFLNSHKSALMGL